MAKKYLRSDMSEQEAHFFTSGQGLFGEENAITGLYKIIGKFSELNETNRRKELSEYEPNKDSKFKYENRGITELNSNLKAKYGKQKFSRKDFKNLSRKWCLSPVLINIESYCIIEELFAYINDDAELKSTCEIYLANTGDSWEKLMPIQFDFLSTRFSDQHKNYKTAGKIINDLSTINFF